MIPERKTFALWLLILAPVASAQEASEQAAPSAEALRQRIHSMRMNLLTGGEKVQTAEAEAAEFFRGKEARIEDRLDTVLVELSEKRASYEVSLDTALATENPASRESAMKRALAQRSSIVALEAEADQLQRKRSDVSHLASAIESRNRERSALTARLDTGGDLDGMLDVPLGMVGLAPAVSEPSSASPYEDEGLLQDLLVRDPRAARALLYDTDPVRYWQRFPLNPPGEALREALAFPLADLPGRR